MWAARRRAPRHPARRSCAPCPPTSDACRCRPHGRRVRCRRPPRSGSPTAEPTDATARRRDDQSERVHAHGRAGEPGRHGGRLDEAEVGRALMDQHLDLRAVHRHQPHGGRCTTGADLSVPQRDEPRRDHVGGHRLARGDRELTRPRGVDAAAIAARACSRRGAAGRRPSPSTPRAPLTAGTAPVPGEE